jgi:hypothetical protein
MNVWLKVLISFAAGAAVVYTKELFVKWFFKEYGKHIWREERAKSKLASTQENILNRVYNCFWSIAYHAPVGWKAIHAIDGNLKPTNTVKLTNGPCWCQVSVDLRKSLPICMISGQGEKKSSELYYKATEDQIGEVLTEIRKQYPW